MLRLPPLLLASPTSYLTLVAGTVYSSPSANFLQTVLLPQVAPLAIASGLAGIAPLLVVGKRTRSKTENKPGNSTDGSTQMGPLSQIMTSVRGPIFLLLLALIALIFPLSPALGNSLAGALAFSGFFLASLIALIRRKYVTVVFFSIFFLGVSATLFSTTLTMTYQAPNLCFPESVEAGFPFPWYMQLIPSQVAALCFTCFYCTPLRLYDSDLQVKIFYFLVDTLFYAACFAGIIMAYNATILMSRKRKLVPTTLRRKVVRPAT